LSKHGPKKVVEDLRNHLAAHDRPLAFLFGAGTSYSINIAPPAKPNEKRPHIPIVPDIAGLTNLCKAAIKQLGDAFERPAWGQLRVSNHLKKEGIFISPGGVRSV